MSLLSVSGEASRESENRKRSSAKNILEKIFFAQLWVLQASPIALNAKANLKFALRFLRRGAPAEWGVVCFTYLWIPHRPRGIFWRLSAQTVITSAMYCG